MATKKAAKELSEMSKTQKAMIKNVETMTEQIAAKIGNVSAAQRQEIKSAVAGTYLPALSDNAKLQGLISKRMHTSIVNLVIKQVTEQFNTTAPVLDALQAAVTTVAKTEKLSRSSLAEVRSAIQSEFDEFHTPVTKGSENWHKQKSVQLIYGATKIDSAFRKRAERHVRGIIKWLRQADEVEAYMVRKQATV
ncbi:MAG TPA: hypothetical protein VGM02_01645 [Acidobacteriaceae bacterium]|jgi:hypothetical protein